MQEPISGFVLLIWMGIWQVLMFCPHSWHTRHLKLSVLDLGDMLIQQLACVRKAEPCTTGVCHSSWGSRGWGWGLGPQQRLLSSEALFWFDAQLSDFIFPLFSTGGSLLLPEILSPLRYLQMDLPPYVTLWKEKKKLHRASFTDSHSSQCLAPARTVQIFPVLQKWNIAN